MRSGSIAAAAALVARNIRALRQADRATLRLSFGRKVNIIDRGDIHNIPLLAFRASTSTYTVEAQAATRCAFRQGSIYQRRGWPHHTTSFFSVANAASYPGRPSQFQLMAACALGPVHPELRTLIGAAGVTLSGQKPTHQPVNAKIGKMAAH